MLLSRHQRNISLSTNNGIIKNTFLKKEKTREVVAIRKKSNHYYSGKEGKFTTLLKEAAQKKPQGSGSLTMRGRAPKTPAEIDTRRVSMIEFSSDYSSIKAGKKQHGLKIDEEELGFENSDGTMRVPIKKHKIMSFEVKKNPQLFSTFNDQVSTACSSLKNTKPQKLATIRLASRFQFQNFVPESSIEADIDHCPAANQSKKTIQDKNPEKNLKTSCSLKRQQVIPETTQPQESNPQDKFSLGDGPWTLKKERVKKLIETLVENEDQYQEFRIRNIKIKPRISLPEPEQFIKRDLRPINKMRQEQAQKQRELNMRQKRNQILKNFNKWDLVRQQRASEIIAQSEKQKKQWRVKQFISMIMTQSILKKIGHSIASQRKQRHLILLQSIASLKLQRYFRKNILKRGPNGPPGFLSSIRDKRRLQVSFSTRCQLTLDTISSRASLTILSFLKQQYGYHNLFIKVKNFCQRAENLQKLCKDYTRNQEGRVVILEDLYHKTQKKMQMSLIKAKKLKIEKRLREVKPEVIKNLLVRYERFCQDQRAYSMNAWRKKVDYQSLSKKQKLLFNMKLEKASYQLHNSKGEIIYDSDKLGKHVDFLPSCLDPDTKTKKFERIRLDQIDPQLLDDKPACICKLAKIRPFDLDFYPTQQVMQKLVMRSVQIQDFKSELWEGFHPVERIDGISWKPDEFI